MAIKKVKIRGGGASGPVTDYQSTIKLPDELAKVFEGLLIKKNMQRSQMFSQLIVDTLESMSEEQKEEAKNYYEGSE
jgi:hypothetical protein